MDNNEESSGKDPFDKDFLITMYQEAGEEYRLRHQLLHNLYYLLIITIVLVAGNFPAFSSSQLFPLWVLLLISGPIFVLLGLVTMKHYVDRRSASSVRNELEQMAEGRHDLDIKRPLRLECHVIGQNSKLEEDSLVEAGSTFKPLLERPDLSARTIAQGMLLIGLVLIGYGLYLVLF